MGGSSTVVVQGSISVNVIDTDVTAHIGRGAQVTADGTVVVDAQGQDDIKALPAPWAWAATPASGCLPVSM